MGREVGVLPGHVPEIMSHLMSSYRFEKPLLEVYRAVAPKLLVLMGGVLISPKTISPKTR